jgi:hypothetical protein
MHEIRALQSSSESILNEVIESDQCCFRSRAHPLETHFSPFASPSLLLQIALIWTTLWLHFAVCVQALCGRVPGATLGGALGSWDCFVDAWCCCSSSMCALTVLLVRPALALPAPIAALEPCPSLPFVEQTDQSALELVLTPTALRVLSVSSSFRIRAVCLSSPSLR